MNAQLQQAFGIVERRVWTGEDPALVRSFELARREQRRRTRPWRRHTR